ncbi:MAG: chlorite dismutase family protein [Chloroflexi bacterium]|nr:chlorite dismutase family protein [Chloroflexota bacterium]
MDLYAFRCWVRKEALVSTNGRQVVRYSFYKVQPEWRRLGSDEKTAGKREFAAVVGEFSEQMMIRPYGLVGTRGDTDFFLWTVADKLDAFQSLATRLFSTGLGRYLTTPHSYLGMTRKTVYVEKHKHEGQEGNRMTVTPKGSKYLFVYPFVKTREWYLLPLERRQEIMSVHIALGHKYPSVKINTTYSFGIDDQDFVVSFESDEPSDFLDLVMDLRETESSLYTVRDTPIFSGISMSIDEVLDTLGG